METTSNAKVDATVGTKNLAAAADKCGMGVETLLNTFWDMGSYHRNRDDEPMESVEAVVSEFGDMVEAECREVGITERWGYLMALNAFCIGYLTK